MRRLPRKYLYLLTILFFQAQGIHLSPGQDLRNKPLEQGHEISSAPITQLGASQTSIQVLLTRALEYGEGVVVR